MKTAVIIVTYNGMNWIEKCIDSILKSAMPSTIIVVDNRSNDLTVSFLQQNYSENIILIESEENLGFGKGNNIGLKYALEHDFDYVFLLNQDAYLETNTLERLIQVSQKNPNYGILSPIHLNYDGTLLEWYFAKFMSMKYSAHFYSDYVIKNQLKDVYETEFVNAAAWLIKREVLEQIGGFDPIFKHYGEDNNYCQRVLFHKYKIGVVSDSYIKHDSKIRVQPPDYFSSKAYFKDYEKVLQTKFGDINIDYQKKHLFLEKRILIKKMMINFFRLNFAHLKLNYKKYKCIDEIFDEIFKSRDINRHIGKHYIG